VGEIPASEQGLDLHRQPADGEQAVHNQALVPQDGPGHLRPPRVTQGQPSTDRAEKADAVGKPDTLGTGRGGCLVDSHSLDRTVRFSAFLPHLLNGQFPMEC
jgi:hypothetical protein